VPANADASSSASAPAGTSQAPSKITVFARRLKLEARIIDFVYGIAALDNYEGVARWQAPVCPLVTGLAGHSGEFVLERLSEIARTAAVPLAGEHCRPNLFIYVTTEPKTLLQAMENRYFARVFGNATLSQVATPSQVDEFINTPRPVRVWHNPYWTYSDPGQGLPPGAQLLGGGSTSYPMFVSHEPPSRLTAQVSWTFGNVYVIVDEAQLHGVSQRQFADYIAMVSLAEIKPTPQLHDVQFILTLFAGSSQAAPAGLSNWDQAFLKSLYGMRPRATQPRSSISRGMMRELVP